MDHLSKVIWACKKNMKMKITSLIAMIPKTIKMTNTICINNFKCKIVANSTINRKDQINLQQLNNNKRTNQFYDLYLNYFCCQ